MVQSGAGHRPNAAHHPRRRLEQKIDEDGKELQCIKTVLLASMQGYAPQTAIEFGRKVLYSTERPTFSELEGHVKKK